MYRHDSSRRAVGPDAPQAPLFLHWRFQPTHAPRPAWYKPAEDRPRMHADSAYHTTVAGGMVFWGSSVDNKIYALDAKTGEVRWTSYTGGPVRYAPNYAGGRLYAGSDDGHVYCLDAGSGDILWTHRAGPTDEKILGNGRMISIWPVRTSVLVDDGVVYFAAGVFPYEGIILRALDAASGAEIWTNDTIGDSAHELSYGGMSPQGYLLASSDVLYVPSGRAMPATFDRKTGAFRNYLSSGGKVGGTWALLDRDELISGVDRSGKPAKVAFDEQTGRRKGDVYAWFPGLDMVCTADVSYVLTETGIHAINRLEYPGINKSLEEASKEQRELGLKLVRLRKDLMGVDEETRAKIQGTMDEALNRIDVLQDEQKRLKMSICKWQHPIESYHAIIQAGSQIIAGGEGRVTGIDIATGKRLWAGAVDGVAIGLAATADGVFVSTDRGTIYCFAAGDPDTPNSIRTDLTESPYPADRLTETYTMAAERILEETDIAKGYCLVLGCGTGRLAYELVKRSDLKVIGLESDPAKRKTARERLDAAGLYGSRIVVEPWPVSDLPDYFANLVVSDGMIASGSIDESPESIYRVLRPYGGVMLLGVPASVTPRGPLANGDSLLAWMQRAGTENPTLASGGDPGLWARLTRAELEGDGDWTHLYASPGNTANSEDDLLNGPLGLLWYGEPGPSGVVERHARAMAPIATNGRMFLQGEETVKAYDSYNGTFLWGRDIPGAVRVRVDIDGGNLAAAEDSLFVAAKDKCYRLDAATGETVRIYNAPPSLDGSDRRWGYVACADGLLFGSTAPPHKMDYAGLWDVLVDNDRWRTIDEVSVDIHEIYVKYLASFMLDYPDPNEDAWAAFHRSGLLWRPMDDYPHWGSKGSPEETRSSNLKGSDTVFAMDVESGQPQWIHRGESIAHISTSIADGKIVFADAGVTKSEREAAVNLRESLAAAGQYENSDSELSAQDADIRRVVVLDAATGEKHWEQVMDLTGCGGDRLGSAIHDGILLFFGCFSNHDGGLFQSFAITWRRITALNLDDGEMIWSRPLNYLRRPVVIGDTLLIEPRACELRTGRIKTRPHPVTGLPVPWEFYRPGHSCSVTAASTSRFYYRSYNAAFYDLERDNGIAYFGAIRPGCWINLIPANGLLLFPESSSGCSCSFPLKCSVALKPRSRPEHKQWTVFVTHGSLTPARHFAINLGAPGDMKADDGTLWLGYPRVRASYGVKFDLDDQVDKNHGYFKRDFKSVEIAGTSSPWLFTNGCSGPFRCRVPLRDVALADSSASYTVRLGFYAPKDDVPGQRVFDIKLQGQTVLAGFDIRKAAGGADRAVIKEFANVAVDDVLAIELVPKAATLTDKNVPIINFVEAICTAAAAEDVAAQEFVQPLEDDEASRLLATATDHLKSDQSDRALEEFHSLFDAAPTEQIRLAALDGMAAVGSEKSIRRLEAFLSNDAPILRDYKHPIPELQRGALETYLAVARNTQEAQRDRAIAQYQRVLALQAMPEIRSTAVERLAGLGVQVDAQLAAEGYITRWHMAGPFVVRDLDAAAGQVMVGEPEIDLNATYTSSGRELRWSDFVADRVMIDLAKVFQPSRYVVVYAYSEFELPGSGELLLKIGSDDGHVCWLNGERVGSSTELRGWKQDEDVLEVTGKKGKNTVLVKSLQHLNEWGFSVRLTDTNNQPIPFRPVGGE